MKKRLFYKFTIFLIISFFSELTCALEQDSIPPKNNLMGFRYNVTDKIGTQGMLFGPLRKESLYTLSCATTAVNSTKLISFEICHNGISADKKICSNTSQTITITINKNLPNANFSFNDLHPIKLKKKWEKILKMSYVIQFSVISNVPFKKGEFIRGNCHITE